EVEGHRQPGRAVCQQVAVAGVRLRRAGVARVLPHRPQLLAVHLAVRAAHVRELPGLAEMEVLRDVGLGVERLDLDAGVGEAARIVRADDRGDRQALTALGCRGHVRRVSTGHFAPGIPCGPVDAYLAIVSKREVREYAREPIPPDVERRILEAGRMAGSSQNRQQRGFVIVRDRAAVERAASAVWMPANLLGAALVVAVVVGGRGPLAFDAGRAAQNMMLAAHALGVGSCPNGIADRDTIAELLGLGEDEQVATILGFGYPVSPRDPESRPAEEWIRRAGRLPYDEGVREL